MTITKTSFDDLVDRLLDDYFEVILERKEGLIKAVLRDYWENVDIVKFRAEAEAITGETIELVD